MSKSTNLGSILQLRSYDADPSTVKNGTMYYNTTTNKVRVYQNSSWGDVAVGSVSLTGQTLAEYSVLIGNATNISTAVNTNAVGHIYANASLGLTIKSGAITNGHVSSAAAIDRTKLASGTPDRVVVNNASGVMTDSTVTTTELGHLSGVSSNIQTQLDTKASETYVDDAIAAIPAADLTPYLKKDGTVRISGNLAPVTSSIVRLGRSTDNSEIQPFYEAFIETVYYGQDGARGHIDGNGGSFRIINDTNNSDISLHVQGTGSINVNNAKIKGVVDPTDAQEAATKNYVDTQVANYLPLSGGSMMGNIHMSGEKITGLGAPTASLDAARKIDIENALSGLDFQKDVDDVQIDNTLVPVATLGKRYVITDSANLNAGFGGITGVEDGDIVEYAASNEFLVVYDVSVQGSGALVWSKQDTSFFRWDGTTWSEFGGLSSLNAGIGLIKTGNVIDVNLGAGISQLPTDEVGLDLHSSSGLMLTEDGTTDSTGTNAQLSIRLDGSTLSKNSSGLKVAAGGITNTEISGSAAIELSKLAPLASNKALVTNPFGVISESAISDTELSFLSGVTSSVQTQLDDKVNKTLSNLTSPTAINQNLLPNASATRTLGINGTAWGRVHAGRYSGPDSSKFLVVSSSSGAVLTFADASSILPLSTYIHHPLFDGVGGSVQVLSKSGNDVTVASAPSSAFSGETVTASFSIALRTEDETTAGMDSGRAIVRTGNVTGAGNSGTMSISTGNSVSGETGDIYIQTGNSGSGSASKGLVEIQGREIVLQSYDGVLIQNASGGTAVLATSNHSLAANTSTFTAISGIGFNRSESKSAHIQYEVVQAGTDEVRTGTLMLAISASNVGVSDVYSVSGGNLDTVIDFDASVDGSGNVEILFKNTDSTNACTFKVLTSNIAI